MRKNAVAYRTGTTNTLTVTDVGAYSCRIRGKPRRVVPIPLRLSIKPLLYPTVKVSGLASSGVTCTDGKTTVNLEVPPGYTAYDWQKVGNSTTLSTANVLTGATVGDYKVQVTEPFGCSSAFTEPFKVINANGPNKPDAATGLIAIPLSYTSLKLSEQIPTRLVLKCL